MSRSWSEQIASRYALELPPDLQAWFDEERWRAAGGAEFNRPLAPDQLLEPSPEVLWAGFMLPDTLPVVGNRYGDWLCLRVGADGRVREVVGWNHAGGDWTPYGRTLAEAMICDAALRLLYDCRPELVDFEPPADDVFGQAAWACRHQGGLMPFWDAAAASQHDPTQLLLEGQVAEVAARRYRALRALESRLKSISDPSLAARIGARWEPEFVRWLFDTSLIPPAVLEQLGGALGTDGQQLIGQDWREAEREALEVIRLRSDLGWAFDVAGWAAERRGDRPEAARRYYAGLAVSAFADDSVAFRTHWFEEGFGKFAAARLAELRPYATSEMQADPYLQMLWRNDAASLRDRVTEFWLARAAHHQRSGDWLAAYEDLYRAGWDCGLDEIDRYREILAGLVTTASAAQAPALARVAQVHLDAFAARHGS